MGSRLLGLVGAIVALVLLAASPAFTDDAGLSVSHVEPAGDQVQILVSLPVGAQPNLEKVSVTLDGKPTEVSAAPAGDSEEKVRRTAILVIDTSDSMTANGRFTAAKSAATTFLDSVPADVFVGVVAFDGVVETSLEPSTDRKAAKDVIAGLELARGTFLNDAVIEATALAGTEGQRSLLVLSDGLDTSRTPLADVQKAITQSEVKVDVVALDQQGSDLVPLQAMSKAGEGQVIPADPAALNAAFSAEAEVLARQVLITADIPDALSKSEATVKVTVPTADATLTAQTFSVIRATADAAPEAPRAASDDPLLQVPRAAMYGGVAAVGLGLLLLVGTLMVMASSRGGPATVEERILAYGGSAQDGARGGDGAAFNLDQARDAATSVLKRNKGLEARIEARLEAAGSAFKPAEWLLLHGGVAILFGVVGLLLGGGSFLMMVLGLGLGVVLPWLWLGHKKRKRIKAFNRGLADTLQLIAGSLSAGMSLAQSINAVVEEGNEPIAGEFQRVLIETRLGVPLEDALNAIAERIESKDFEWVVMAIRIQREVGGNLAELLTTVAGTLREREYLRRQVKTLSSEGRLSAYILCGLPVLVAVYLSFARWDYIQPLFTTGIGILLLFAAAGLLSLGGFIMSRIVKVEV